MAEKTGYSVLRLPLYYCILNPTEMSWNHLKYHVLYLNVYKNNPLKGVNLIRKVCKENISTEIEITEEEMFRIMDHIFDN